MSSPTDLPFDVHDVLDRPDVPDADAAEQAREVLAHDPLPLAAPWPSSLEVDEYDAAEQRIIVDVDEDEYR
ncbi:hypothetical protein [Candidatus Protofrankia californiensis]|uniref:hypothetical protein n=1 Tax=Candidatus Protofrankia californiensis TaxID=1839754 RepID=UPI0010411CA9|nr:hypothetical protein [Candidatus Protofrankia californiensis]